MPLWAPAQLSETIQRSCHCLSTRLGSQQGRSSMHADLHSITKTATEKETTPQHEVCAENHSSLGEVLDRAHSRVTPAWRASVPAAEALVQLGPSSAFVVVMDSVSLCSTEQWTPDTKLPIPGMPQATDETLPEAPALRGHAIKPNKAQGTLWGVHRDARGNW